MTALNAKFGRGALRAAAAGIKKECMDEKFGSRQKISHVGEACIQAAIAA